MKNHKQYPFGFQILIFALLLSAHSYLYATPIDMSIQSGSGWVTTTTPGSGSGWTDTGYDDSAWINAYAPYPNIYTPGAITLVGTSAEYMWHWDSTSIPNGTTGPYDAYFRYDFNLSLSMDSLPLVGQGFVAADDNFDFYVNGNLVLSSNPSINDINPAHFVDFSSFLQNGDNVLALVAQDTVGAYEWAFFDGIIRTTNVPEPGSLALFGLGVLGMFANRKKRKVN